VLVAGELRHGDWGLVDEAAVDDVMATPPELLRGRLVSGSRLLWLR
jgi:hypothetical protein